MSAEIEEAKALAAKVEAKISRPPPVSPWATRAALACATVLAAEHFGLVSGWGVTVAAWGVVAYCAAFAGFLALIGMAWGWIWLMRALIRIEESGK